MLDNERYGGSIQLYFDLDAVDLQTSTNQKWLLCLRFSPDQQFFSFSVTASCVKPALSNWDEVKSKEIWKYEFCVVCLLDALLMGNLRVAGRRLSTDCL